MALFPIAANQVQFSTDTPVATDTYARSILRDAGNTVARSASSGGVQYANGLLFTALGQVVTIDATAGLPAGTQFVNGLPLTPTGALCISTNAAVSWSNGLPFASNGALAAGSILPFLKAAALAAPVNQAGISYVASPTFALLAQGGVPTWPGGYVRHFVSGVQGTGVMDLATASNIFGQTTNNSPVQGGGPTNNMDDGSKAQYWGTGVDASIERGCRSPTKIAFRHTGRYLAFPSQTQAIGTITINGAISTTVVDWNVNNQNATFDFGSVAARDIVLTGADCWYSEVLCGTGETISQAYNPFATAPTVGWLGDSYLDLSADWTTSKMLFCDLMTQLMGGRGYTCNAIGATGYSNNNGDAVNTPAANTPARQQTMVFAKPDVMCVCLGINDAWPGAGATDFTTCATTTLQAARANSKLLVVMGPWAPNQTNGANAGGSYQGKKNVLRALLPTIGGSWIYLDNLSGGWLTSKGTSSAGAGPWQTGDGYVGNTTGTGNGDTWVSADGTHPTELGYRGLAALWAASYKAALASM